MRSGIIITTSIIAFVLSWIINHNSVSSYQSGTFLEQSEFQLSGGNDSSVQEKTRYLYVGAKTCVGKCHNNTATGYQNDIWKRSRHSKSYLSLASEKALRYSKRAGINENPQESAICLKCHITGSGLDSSSYGDTYTKEEGITCEACHKGEFITKSFLPKETDCLRCHNDSVHKTGKFDFNSKYAKIAHPKPEAKLKET
jgi:hypothetical protein